METYLVGGAVRDKLLGLPVRERDWVVVGSTAEAMLALGYQPVGKDFPVFLHPQTKEEYALARTERKTGPGYTGFETNAGPGTSTTACCDISRPHLPKTRYVSCASPVLPRASQSGAFMLPTPPTS